MAKESRFSLRQKRTQPAKPQVAGLDEEGEDVTTRSTQREGWGVEIIVSLILAFVALLIHSFDLGPKTELPVELLLVFMELSFISYRLFDRRVTATTIVIQDAINGIQGSLNRTVRGAVPLLDPDTLSAIAYLWLDRRRDRILSVARALSKLHAVELEKAQTYRTVIDLTEVVSSQALGSILAVSCINIEDFEDEPLAEQYLTANRSALENGIEVRRLFLLTVTQRDEPRVRSIIETHANALNPPGNTEENVRWALITQVAQSDREDFALFAGQAAVRQFQNGRYELNDVPATVKQLGSVFDRLWNNRGIAKSVSAFPKMHYGRSR
jgi:hypothetical protein